MTYPRSRPRRLRHDEWTRRLVAENTLSADDFIWPLFIHEAKGTAAIASMPEVQRLDLDNLWRAAERAQALGIPAVALFPVIAAEQKTADGQEAWNAEGLIPRAIAGLKSRFPTLGVMTDAALDPYTSHGQDGVIDHSGYVLNDETVACLRRQALAQAAAGADIVAPSDMMDGRIGVLRDALEEAGFIHTKILSYAAKYASSFYGPFRDAVGSAAALGHGDKRTYQMDPANMAEAMMEMRLDLAEGADLLMVKPGMTYLDVLRRAADTFDVPIFAYQVSGEYAMLHAAAACGWLDLETCMMESLLAFKRAGARGVLTYFAATAATLLAD